MEKSKLISVFIAKLKVAYPNYFNKITNDDLVLLISMYQEMLGNYNENILNEVAKKIIETKKYMPTIAEILEMCNSTKIMVRNEIIEKMIEDGYFKGTQEIDKVYLWLNEGIIPKWLQNDMLKYHNLIIQKNEKLIEG